MNIKFKINKKNIDPYLGFNEFTGKYNIKLILFKNKKKILIKIITYKRTFEYIQFLLYNSFKWTNKLRKKITN